MPIQITAICGSVRPGNFTAKALQVALDELATHSDIEVTAVSLAGDYNADGVVDAADYTVWRDALGQAASLPNETATPGQVTQADYDAWLANFGATLAPSGASAAPAPEPAAVGLLGLVCSWFPLRRVR